MGVCWKRTINPLVKMFYWQFWNLFASESGSYMIPGSLFTLDCSRLCSFYVAWITPIVQFAGLLKSQKSTWSQRDFHCRLTEYTYSVKKKLHPRHLKLSIPSPSKFDNYTFVSWIQSHKIPSSFTTVCDHSRNTHFLVKSFIEKEANNSHVRGRCWIMHDK